MLNNKGSILVESLISLSIITIIISTIIPISTLLNQESNTLKEKMSYTTLLHDELQTVIFETSANLPIKYMKHKTNTKLEFIFEQDNDLIKGCVTWNNVKKRQETSCLYAYLP